MLYFEQGYWFNAMMMSEKIEGDVRRNTKGDGLMMSEQLKKNANSFLILLAFILYIVFLPKRAKGVV